MNFKIIIQLNETVKMEIKVTTFTLAICLVNSAFP